MWCRSPTRSFTSSLLPQSTIATPALPELKFVPHRRRLLSPVTFQPTLLQALSQLIGEALVSTGPQGTQPAGPDGEPAADPAPGRRAQGIVSDMTTSRAFQRSTAS